MILVDVFRNENEGIERFCVKNHGDEKVCAAVSLLVMNTINSIEFFCKEDGFVCDYSAGGGYIEFTLHNPNDVSAGTALLLESMVLGLQSLQKNYSKDLRVKEVLAIQITKG